AEAARIFGNARCARELVYYPRGAHECFNVLADRRPRMTGWVARQLAKHRIAPPPRPKRAGPDPRDAAFLAGEAVDPDFADDLAGEGPRMEWHSQRENRSLGARFSWPWAPERQSPGGPPATAG